LAYGPRARSWLDRAGGERLRSGVEGAPLDFYGLGSKRNGPRKGKVKKKIKGKV
jgi:hypothetical protein